jgi:uncharacterized membrane protein
MLTFLFCLAIYLLIAFVTSLAFLAQSRLVMDKASYASFDADMRIRIMVTGSALSMYLLLAFLMGICWPYTYYCRICDLIGGRW